MSQPATPSDADATSAGVRASLRQFVSKRSVGDWIAVAVIVLGATALLVMFPLVRVCDQHLTDAGEVETVCRHLALNDPPVVVVGALVVLAMSAFFAEVSVSGLTVKRRLELVERKADWATDEAGRANETATAAKSEARDALAAAARYERVRRDLKARTSERDTEQTDAWNEMAEDLRDQPEFDLAGHLASQDEGMRLAGFAWASTHRDPGRATQVAEAMFGARGFTQEMGIRALAATIGDDCDALGPELRARLLDLKSTVVRRAQRRNDTSNRATEIDRLLQRCPD
ncbi:hypothetical protein [Pengzhenrongella frigida]|uniref:Uncharacterized protein n=1 Tax=Pengzhenrongella frigida TaxID=1259133 RepID=A0A4Q5N4A7_9MICO|nr:hypothetical protein [Cellulomonas sp. HLT2-17]RYV52143.1 hypothetical protein EUA98_05120 [Cellulomonas sp. HLT2-17]